MQTFIIGCYLHIDNMPSYPPLKHVVDSNRTAEAGNIIRTIVLAVGTLNPDPYTVQTNVKNQNIITKITLQIDSGIQGNLAFEEDLFDWFVWFNINGAQATPDPTGTNLSHLKNQIFHQDGQLYNKIAATATQAFFKNGVWRIEINIPRAWQQINDGDTIEFVYKWTQASAVHDLKFRAIYKEVFP